MIDRDFLGQRKGAVIDVHHHAVISHTGENVALVNGLNLKRTQGCFRFGQHRGCGGIIEVQLIRRYEKLSIPGIGALPDFSGKLRGIERTLYGAGWCCQSVGLSERQRCHCKERG